MGFDDALCMHAQPVVRLVHLEGGGKGAPVVGVVEAPAAGSMVIRLLHTVWWSVSAGVIRASLYEDLTVSHTETRSDDQCSTASQRVPSVIHGRVRGGEVAGGDGDRHLRHDVLAADISSSRLSSRSFRSAYSSLSPELTKRTDRGLGVARSQHVVLSHFLKLSAAATSPCMIERGNLESTIKNAAASRSVYIPRYVLRKASCPPQPREHRRPLAAAVSGDADATSREVMSSLFQGSAHGHELPAIVADHDAARDSREHGAALAYPVQEHMGAAGPNGVVGSWCQVVLTPPEVERDHLAGRRALSRAAAYAK